MGIAFGVNIYQGSYMTSLWIAVAFMWMLIAYGKNK